MAMSEAAAHPDFEIEQAYLHAARRSLESMQQRAEETLEFGERAVREENTAEARIARAHLADRAASLELGAATLCFGRIDEDPLVSDGDCWYVGRRHIENADTEPVVVDWRVPVAIPFYRATAADAQGLALRRRFTCEADTLLAIFDEHLDDPESVVGAGLPDPLLAEIERSRTGEMADIVATIAAEQDEIIRAPLAECLIVQGGPGTGKTAVGLHRAAFLLFEHREELSSSRVLVVGPNRMFLNYVGNVLPSLGETAVTQSTVQSLLDVKYRLRGEDSLACHVLKGDLRMSQVLRRAALDKLRAPTEDVRLPVGARTVTLRPEQIAEAQQDAASRDMALNDARRIFSQLLLREVKQELVARELGELQVDETVGAVRSSADFKKLVARTWPTLGAVTLVQSVLSNKALLARASSGLLDDEERRLLHRSAARKGEPDKWTVADLALLDEAQELCGGVATQYGHVVVDEAQDLSAMALRVVGRRARKGSITILGDIAQATAPGAQESWDDVVTALGIDVAETAVRRAELTVGYRVPGPILDYANALLPITAPDITPSTSVRHAGPGPTIAFAKVDERAVVVAEAVASSAEAFRTTGVIAAASELDALLEALREAGLEAVDTRTSEALGATISVVDATAAKGLEFDSVVVVEPAALSELPNGLRLLYVALTRAVQRLTIVHSAELPAPL